MAEARKRLRIHGLVQGVFYRAWSRETATALGRLYGFVMAGLKGAKPS